MAVTVQGSVLDTAGDAKERFPRVLTGQQALVFTKQNREKHNLWSSWGFRGQRHSAQFKVGEGIIQKGFLEESFKNTDDFKWWR